MKAPTTRAALPLGARIYKVSKPSPNCACTVQGAVRSPPRSLVSYMVRSLKVIACLKPKAKPYRRDKGVTMHRMHATPPEQHTSNSRVYTISKHLFQLHDRAAFIPPLFH